MNKFLRYSFVALMAMVFGILMQWKEPTFYSIKTIQRYSQH